MRIKISILTIMFLTGICTNGFSQRAVLVTEQYYSDNRKYAIEMTGLAYDAFGICTLVLYNESKQALWTKIIDFHGIPAISNMGDVAIPQSDNTIEYYDKYGTLQGQSVFSDIFDVSVCYAFCIVHHYSWDGLRYYLFTKNINDRSVTLWGMDHRGKQLWKLPFKQYLDVYHIKTTSERILFAVHSSEQKTIVYFIDSRSGNILNTYTESYDPIFLQDEQTFILKSSGKFKLYRSLNGDFIKDLTFEDVPSLLDMNQPQYLLLALEYLEWQTRNASFSFSEQMRTRLKNLKGTDDFSFQENADILGSRGRILEYIGIENLYYQNSQPYTGTVEYHYLNGNVESVQSYQNGHLKAMTRWSNSGEKQTETIYRNGSTDAIESYKEWSPHGELIEEHYDNNTQ
jgi:hypothetical protein